MSQDSMTHESDVNIGIATDITALPISKLDEDLDRLNTAGIISDSSIPISFHEPPHQTESDEIISNFQNHVRMIGKLMRDHGNSQHEVLQFENTLPSINNENGTRKQSLLEELKQKRTELAISNYPLYLELFSGINPEDLERFTKMRNEFIKADTSDERKAEISENIRAELETVIHWKTMFYTEMLSTVMVDSGEPLEMAEEYALIKAEMITTRANSLIEKVSSFEALKNESLTHLISHLQSSILVWEELFPGEGETEEMKILGERKETRMRNAKNLYKRTVAELDKRYADYKLRAERSFKEEGSNNGHDVSSGLALKKAIESTSKLLSRPRLEQIRVMKSGMIIK